MGIIRFLLNIYILLLIVDAILSYMPQLKSNDYVKKLRMITDFSCEPVRKLLPSDLPFDVSPLVIIVSIKIIELLW